MKICNALMILTFASLSAIANGCSKKKEDMYAKCFLMENYVFRPLNVTGTILNVTGTITFSQSSPDAHVEITSTDISNLPKGKHGFHIHTYGVHPTEDGKNYHCSTAGGHFNPEGKAHGAPTSTVRHVGDLGNIEADFLNKATVSIKDSIVSLSGPNSIAGRAVVIHSGEDNFEGESGNAGTRVACCNIVFTEN